MKSRVVKQVNVVLEKDEKELVKKVITLISDLINTGINNGCDGYYEIDGISREAGEFEDIIEFLADLVHSEVIELT